MSAEEIYRQFLTGMKHTTLPEYIAVIFGILSVFFSRKENILVYPVGLVSTITYIWISIQGDLFGEASVNLFYTIMSIYGWVLWAKRDKLHQPAVRIMGSTKKEWLAHFTFFMLIYLAIFISLSIMKKYFTPGAIPWADGFASATAFAGMWLMAKKKVESWYWWIATNIASIPLYFVKGYVFTSFFYFVLLVMAFWGWAAWKKKASMGNGQLAMGNSQS